MTEEEQAAVEAAALEAAEARRLAVQAAADATAHNCDICRRDVEPHTMRVFEGGPTFEMIRLCGGCLSLAQQMACPWNRLPVWDRIWERIKSRRYVEGVPNAPAPVDPDGQPSTFISGSAPL